MKISRAIIKNYRNLRNVDVCMGSLVTLVGENNSGKSNLLKAITFPLLSDEGHSKRLSWYDINNEVKDSFYQYLEDNRSAIHEGAISLTNFVNHIPEVSVTLEFEGAATEGYDLKDLSSETRDGKIIYSVQYLYRVDKPQELLDRIKGLLTPEAKIKDIRMSLLPMELYSYSILIPGKSAKVSYDTLRRFRYVALPAERDNFAANTDRLGSRALTDILQYNLTPSAQVEIEREYVKFFNTVKEYGNLDAVINWQDYSKIPNAKDFFDEISILPNMPSMNSILGSVRLGYSDDNLAFQGLGYRNLILMMVMLNSYLSKSNDDLSLLLVTVEEPEAHLCINNILLMTSFFNIFNKNGRRTQLIYSTHNAEFVNKSGLDNVVILHDGTAYSLKSEIDAEERDYLAKNPNTDICKTLFSRRLIMVEGITEELLIKSYLQTKPELNEIKVLSFHKGYKDIIEIWKKVNSGSGNRLGIVRDFDNQPKAQKEHEELQDRQVMVCTTKKYTLETELVNAGDNYILLKERYGADYGWSNMSADELQADWRDNKTDVILRICHDLVNGELSDFQMPQHIQRIINFMQSEGGDSLDIPNTAVGKGGQ